MLRILIIAIIIAIILKIHEIYLVFKWTNISSIIDDIENEDQDVIEFVENRIRKTLGKDDEPELVNEDGSRINIYGPFTKESAEIRAEHRQFIDNSIIIVREPDNSYTPYYTCDGELKLIQEATENIYNKIKKYLEDYLSHNKSELDKLLHYIGIFTQDEYNQMKNNNKIKDNDVFGIYCDNDKSSYKTYVYHSKDDSIEEVIIESLLDNDK